MGSNTEQNMSNLYSNRIPLNLFDKETFRKVLKVIERRELFAKYSQIIIGYEVSYFFNTYSKEYHLIFS
jgi:hypothetical protein